MKMLTALALALAGLAAPVGAAELDAELLKCAAETDDAQRLVCYDRTVARISGEAGRVIAERRAASEKLAAERAAAEAAARTRAAADAEAAKRDAFGAERLRPGFGDNDVGKLDAAVVETLSDRDGMTVFILDNGQMWRQASGIGLPPVRKGDKVEISRGAVGGYNLWLPRQKRSVKARRMR